MAFKNIATEYWMRDVRPLPGKLFNEEERKLPVITNLMVPPDEIWLCERAGRDEIHIQAGSAVLTQRVQVLHRIKA